MSEKPYFPILEAEISRRGIKKGDIAKAIGIKPKSISNKLTGKQEFKLNEIRIIQSLIPDVSLDMLFSHDKAV